MAVSAPRKKFANSNLNAILGAPKESAKAKVNPGPAVRSTARAKPVVKPKGLVSLGKAPVGSNIHVRKGAAWSELEEKAKQRQELDIKDGLASPDWAVIDFEDLDKPLEGAAEHRGEEDSGDHDDDENEEECEEGEEEETVEDGAVADPGVDTDPRTARSAEARPPWLAPVGRSRAGSGEARVGRSWADQTENSDDEAWSRPIPESFYPPPPNGQAPAAPSANGAGRQETYRSGPAGFDEASMPYAKAQLPVGTPPPEGHSRRPAGPPPPMPPPSAPLPAERDRIERIERIDRMERIGHEDRSDALERGFGDPAPAGRRARWEGGPNAAVGGPIGSRGVTSESSRDRDTGHNRDMLMPGGLAGAQAPGDFRSCWGPAVAYTPAFAPRVAASKPMSEDFEKSGWKDKKLWQPPRPDELERHERATAQVDLEDLRHELRNSKDRDLEGSSGPRSRLRAEGPAPGSPLGPASPVLRPGSAPIGQPAHRNEALRNGDVPESRPSRPRPPAQLPPQVAAPAEPSRPSKPSRAARGPLEALDPESSASEGKGSETDELPPEYAVLDMTVPRTALVINVSHVLKRLNGCCSLNQLTKTIKLFKEKTGVTLESFLRANPMTFKLEGRIVYLVDRDGEKWKPQVDAHGNAWSGSAGDRAVDRSSRAKGGSKGSEGKGRGKGTKETGRSRNQAAGGERGSDKWVVEEWAGERAEGDWSSTAWQGEWQAASWKS